MMARINVHYAPIQPNDPPTQHESSAGDKRPKTDKEEENRTDLSYNLAIRGVDAYFGSLISSYDLMKELGITASVSPVPGERPISPVMHDSIMFHENEYNVYQSKNAMSTLVNEPDHTVCPSVFAGYETHKAMMKEKNASLEQHRQPLREITNALKPVELPRKVAKISSDFAEESPNPADKKQAVDLTDPDIELRRKRFEGDLYTPRWVRGKGGNKEGFCELCVPGIWLKIKQSAYWYHLNFHHGVSASTGRPYPDPVRTRALSRGLSSGETMLVNEGFCENCAKWIEYSAEYEDGTLCDANSRPQGWWRHLQKCVKAPPRGRAPQKQHSSLSDESINLKL